MPAKTIAATAVALSAIHLGVVDDGMLGNTGSRVSGASAFFKLTDTNEKNLVLMWTRVKNVHTMSKLTMEDA